ncbi:radical SAM family heme chaperone HemW [Natronincola peptidivorans]|uniref:radical SAM family heme chaperone HemW n=1 Tax=Natronincola peptidivorans TaxID=426128 RepID=UPI001FCA5CE6|nr:radical SAM family heme chaperone HemW [Natronincola peptidivorans]
MSIYIHIPFCKKKCYYCDFISYSNKEDKIQEYIDALKKEMLLYKEELSSCEIKSIFIGGGTPSILSEEQVASMMNSLYENYRIAKDAEISMESNPGLLNHDKLKAYFNSGINRLSIGLQASQDHLLNCIGRIHRYDDFLKNLQEARAVGFTNINVDLMFGLPGQTLKDWQDTIEKIVDLEVPHIAAYSLIIEEDTLFYSWEAEGRIEKAKEEVELQMYHHAIDYLKKKGYQHYEISNFAKTNYQCKHNIVYWKNKPYIGFGAAAHSYFQDERFNNYPLLDTYIESIKNEEKPVENRISLSFREEISETMFLGLRMIEGVSIEEFQKRFKLSPFDIYENKLQKLQERKLVTYDKERIRLTKTGNDLANIVFQEMLLD